MMKRLAKRLWEHVVDTFWYNLGRVPEKVFYIDDHVQGGNCSVVDRLFRENPNLVEYRDGFGTPLLSLAVQENQRKMSLLLLRLGCDVNASDANGATPLHHAVCDMNLALAKLLLAHGASATIADENGDTPLDWEDGDNRRRLEDLVASVGEA